MAFIIKDTNPQYGGECYFVGTRKIKDPNGRDCEAADFGDRANAKQFGAKSTAQSYASNLNKIAGRTQFVVEEVSIYTQKYGQHRKTNGFAGYGHLPSPEPSMHGGFEWIEEDDGYNGF